MRRPSSATRGGMPQAPVSSARLTATLRLFSTGSVTMTIALHLSSTGSAALRLSSTVKNQHILNQLDVLFVLEVSIPCTTACIFFTEISTSSSFSSIKSPRGGSQALAIGFKLVLCCPSDGALLLKFRFLVFKRWTRTAFLKSCG